MPRTAEQRASDWNGRPRPLTEEDLHRPADRRGQIRRTPGLAADALRMVWAASPRHLLAMGLTQLLASAGVAAQLLIARRILEELIAVSDGGSTSALYPPLAVFVGVTIFVAVMNALASYIQRMLVELVGRHAFDRIVAVGSSVDYTRLEQPDFHDQLQRAIRSGDFRIIDMVTGLNQLIGALLTTGAIAGVLLFLSPLLLVAVALGAVPALAAALRNSRETYAFEYAMTQESRERAYMLSLVTARAAGKEVRLFGLAGHLRRRYRDLTDERVRQMRIFLRKRLHVTLLGGLASALGLGLALATLVYLLARGWLEDQARQPLWWDSALRHFWQSHLMQTTLRRIAVLADAIGTRVSHPLADPDFIAALARDGGRTGFTSRAAAMTTLFRDDLPPDLIRRHSKASFNDVLWNDHTRAFVDTFDEGRLRRALDHLELSEIVDAGKLAGHWSEPSPMANSFLLLQACWLTLQVD